MCISYLAAIAVQIYWNVGCQMVALNFQTSGMCHLIRKHERSLSCMYTDVPVQINHAKFEFNGNTGFLYKPWVMNREGAAKGVFNPFVQSKLEDIVPAKLQVKVGIYIIVYCMWCVQYIEILPIQSIDYTYVWDRLFLTDLVVITQHIVPQHAHSSSLFWVNSELQFGCSNKPQIS